MEYSKVTSYEFLLRYHDYLHPFIPLYCCIKLRSFENFIAHLSKYQWRSTSSVSWMNKWFLSGRRQEQFWRSIFRKSCRSRSFEGANGSGLIAERIDHQKLLEYRSRNGPNMLERWADELALERLAERMEDTPRPLTHPFMTIPGRSIRRKPSK